MIREIKIAGLARIEKNLDAEVLVQPEIDDARDTIVTRIQRGGKGLGAKRNTLSAATLPLSARVTTSLIYPRTTGTSWQRKNEAIVKAMGPRVVNKMVKRIEARWAGEQAGGGDAA